jgi:hypothetical protein
MTRSGRSYFFPCKARPKRRRVNSGKELPDRLEARLVCEGPDRLRVPLPRCPIGTSLLSAETAQMGGFAKRRVPLLNRFLHSAGE